MKYSILYNPAIFRANVYRYAHKYLFVFLTKQLVHREKNEQIKESCDRRSRSVRATMVHGMETSVSYCHWTFVPRGNVDADAGNHRTSAHSSLPRPLGYPGPDGARHRAPRAVSSCSAGRDRVRPRCSRCMPVTDQAAVGRWEHAAARRGPGSKRLLGLAVWACGLHGPLL